ncbi:hypothetical protein ABIB73_004952 [Bradyrhizobium sp. F1.4.3]|uniref:DUF4326 domain-containing protein n=1 Tax=Bradyrhizobium sp. F1.4.3 TaxID=3156356 RepID=UPI003392BCA1
MPVPRVYNVHHRNAPDDAVYVGRSSPYGNRFAIKEHGDQVCNLFDRQLLPAIDTLDYDYGALNDFGCFRGFEGQ